MCLSVSNPGDVIENYWFKGKHFFFMAEYETNFNTWIQDKIN